MMDKEQISDDALEALFEDARATPPEVPAALMAQIMADAENAMPAPAPQGWRGWLAALGGLPALGGLVTATCVGFWLGVAPPVGVPDFAGQVLGVDAALEDDFETPGVSGFGWDIGEG